MVRVGLVAKGLFLRDDKNHIHLVAICMVRPTTYLLIRVVDLVREQLKVLYHLL